MAGGDVDSRGCPETHRVLAPESARRGRAGHHDGPGCGARPVSGRPTSRCLPYRRTSRWSRRRGSAAVASSGGRMRRRSSNAHITEAGNLQLLLNVAGPPAARRILWDEHYHGHSRSLWSYAAGTPLPWLGAQLALDSPGGGGRVFATAWTGARAPGGPTHLADGVHRDAAGAVRARRGRRRRGRDRTARFKRAVTSACGLPVDTTDDALVSTPPRAGSASAPVRWLTSWLRANGAIHDPNLAAAEALEHIRAADRRSLSARAASARFGRPHRRRRQPVRRT